MINNIQCTCTSSSTQLGKRKAYNNVTMDGNSGHNDYI